VFEPDLIRDALTNVSKVTLGHLIFGEEQWKASGQSIPHQDDPLTALYHELGAFNIAFINYRVITLFLESIGSDTNLMPYDTLFSNEDQHTRKIKESYTYQINDNK